jgi:hypothetical protein
MANSPNLRVKAESPWPNYHAIGGGRNGARHLITEMARRMGGKLRNLKSKDAAAAAETAAPNLSLAAVVLDYAPDLVPSVGLAAANAPRGTCPRGTTNRTIFEFGLSSAAGSGCPQLWAGNL